MESHQDIIHYAQNLLEAGSEHPQWLIKFSACEALAHLQQESGESVILEGLANENAATRDRAVIALNKLQQNKYASLFQERLEDSDIFVRSHALEALAQIANKKANKVKKTLTAIEKALEDKNDLVKESAIIALSFLKAQHSHPILESIAQGQNSHVLLYPLRLRASYYLAKQGNTVGFQVLEEALSCEDAWIAFLAARNLGELGSSKGVPLLKEMAILGEWKDKLMALESLIQLGEDITIDQFYRPEKAPDLSTRIDAALVLRKKAPRAIRDLLKEALDLENEGVQTHAIEAITKLGNPEELELLEKIFYSAPEHIRASAVKVAEQIGTPSCFPYLQPVLEASHWLLRLQTAKVILLIAKKHKMLE